MAAAVCALACGGGERPNSIPTLHFSAIPDQDETRLRERFEPWARYLSESLDVPVAYVHATDYADAVDLFKHGDVQLAWFGGLTGVQARHAVPGALAIAQGEEDPHYYSYFIAHADSGIAAGEDYPEALRGKTFAFGSMGSTSGRLMPEHFVRTLGGAAPDEYFAAVQFSGSHDRTVELVESGQLAAGAVNYKVYERRVAEGQTDPEQVRVVWKTPTYPDYNFTAHPVLEERYGEGFTLRLQRTLVAVDDPALLGAFPRRRLIRAENADFVVIEKLARELGFLR
ncbi:MAG: putative selenate ABC transporter substrate-binding protein [Proteobacteria bacterium]|nr:putative selenate ABC transporter substrate-binding protein [Pseudomonadota bacterium]